MRMAELESNTAATVVARLFNAEATLPGGEVVPVIFDRPYGEAFDGDAGGNVPRAVGRTSDLADAARGTLLTIGATAYQVTANEPDGTGVTTLRLRT